MSACASASSTPPGQMLGGERLVRGQGCGEGEDSILYPGGTGTPEVGTAEVVTFPR